MTNEMIAVIVIAVVVVAAFWAPLFMVAVYAHRAQGRLDVLTSQGKQAQARLDALHAAIAAADQASEARSTKMLNELRVGRETVGAAAREVGHVGQQLAAVVRDADGSFRHLADSLKDLDTLQQMSGHVQRFALEMAGASAKIESQLGAAGKVLDSLHGVVDAWSKERAPLEAQHEALAREVEKALQFERDERHQLRLMLNAMLLTTNTGDPDARA